jgi:hypothetical protein
MTSTKKVINSYPTKSAVPVRRCHSFSQTPIPTSGITVSLKAIFPRRVERNEKQYSYQWITFVIRWCDFAHQHNTQKWYAVTHLSYVHKYKHYLVTHISLHNKTTLEIPPSSAAMLTCLNLIG